MFWREVVSLAKFYSRRSWPTWKPWTATLCGRLLPCSFGAPWGRPGRWHRVLRGDISVDLPVRVTRACGAPATHSAPGAGTSDQRAPTGVARLAWRVARSRLMTASRGGGT
jgi:hypothetical protein